MNSIAMHKLSYGLYVLAASYKGKDNACIINTALQVTSLPNQLSICVSKSSYTHDIIMESRKFTVSVISQSADFELFRHFGFTSGRNTNKFENYTSCKRDSNGIYYITEGTNAFISVIADRFIDLGTHTMFIGEVSNMEILNEVPSATYEYYLNNIKPKPQTVGKTINGETIWRCSVCGYEYVGDNLPDDFICPVCNHPASDFNKITIMEEKKMAKYVCPVCGYVHEGDEAPEKCPQCGVAGSKFIKKEETGTLTFACEHEIGIAKAVTDQEIIDGLHANFNGECTEVGMYLAMARAAFREGYPEIGQYWEKAAYEEAEHAAKFAELLGEVVSPSTKENLTKRVAAEHGATEGKLQLAKKAKELGLDAIHDTVHEMAKDEARHGKAFEGLLKRYFG